MGERLQAALAGLQELQVLREKQRELVRAALAMPQRPAAGGGEQPLSAHGKEHRLEATLTALKEQLVRDGTTPCPGARFPPAGALWGRSAAGRGERCAAAPRRAAGHPSPLGSRWCRAGAEGRRGAAAAAPGGSAPGQVRAAGPGDGRCGEPRRPRPSLSLPYNGRFFPQAGLTCAPVPPPEARSAAGGLRATGSERGGEVVTRRCSFLAAVEWEMINFSNTHITLVSARLLIAADFWIGDQKARRVRYA